MTDAVTVCTIAEAEVTDAEAEVTERLAVNAEAPRNRRRRASRAAQNDSGICPVTTIAAPPTTPIGG